MFCLNWQHKHAKDSCQWTISAGCSCSKWSTSASLTALVRPSLGTARGQDFSLSSPDIWANPITKPCFSFGNPTHVGCNSPVAMRITKWIICFFTITVFIMKEMMYFNYCLLWCCAISLLSCLLENSTRDFQVYFLKEPKRY